MAEFLPTSELFFGENLHRLVVSLTVGASLQVVFAENSLGSLVGCQLTTAELSQFIFIEPEAGVELHDCRN